MAALTPFQSQVIAYLRLVMIIGLVLLHFGSFPGGNHDHFSGWAGSATPLPSAVNSSVLFFFMAAVPLLSIISGFLFFRRPVEGSASPQAFFVAQWKRRLKSVAQPMVLWNLLWLGAMFALVTVGRSRGLFGAYNFHFDDFGPREFAWALFGGPDGPITMPLWFLHDLLLTFLVSPVIYLVLRFARHAGLAAILTLWLVSGEVPVFYNLNVMAFFAVGAWLALESHRGHDRIPSSGRLAWPLLAIYTGLVVLRASMTLWVADPFWLELATRGLRIVGSVTLWVVGCRIVAARGPVTERIIAWSSFAFFLHCSHWPTVDLIKTIVGKVLPGRSDAVLLLNYAVTPALCLLVCGVAAVAFNRMLPKVFARLNGGRSL